MRTCCKCKFWSLVEDRIIIFQFGFHFSLSHMRLIQNKQVLPDARQVFAEFFFFLVFTYLFLRIFH